MSGLAAALRALLIVAFFFATTVWLPDFVLKIDAVNRAAETTQHSIAAAIWIVALAAVMWLLRRAQKRGWI